MQRKLLKNKNYMLLIMGNFVSLMGSNIQQFVLSLYVLSITGSATIFASMLAISILPRILLSPIAGVFGDWFDKKKAIIILDVINALVLFSFAGYLLFYNDLSIALIYVLVVVLEITEIFFHSSMSAVLPSVVEKDQYLEANSLRTILTSIGQLMAPVFGALIFGAFGLMIAVLINAISFLFSAFSELFIKIPKLPDQHKKKSYIAFKNDLIAGFKIVKESKPIRTIISVALIINFSIAPFFSVGLIFLVKEVLMQSNIRLGLLQTALSASMIMAPLLLTKKVKKMKLGDVLIKSITIISILIMLVSFSTYQAMFAINEGLVSYIYILTLSFLIGVFVTTVNISTLTLLQKIVPLEFMGRTTTILTLFATIAVPLGQMFFGYLYDIINPGIVVILNGFIILSVVFLYYQRIKIIGEEDTAVIKEKIIESRVLVNEV